MDLRFSEHSLAFLERKKKTKTHIVRLSIIGIDSLISFYDLKKEIHNMLLSAAFLPFKGDYRLEIEVKVYN